MMEADMGLGGVRVVRGTDTALVVFEVNNLELEALGWKHVWDIISISITHLSVCVL